MRLNFEQANNLNKFEDKNSMEFCDQQFKCSFNLNVSSTLNFNVST